MTAASITASAGMFDNIDKAAMQEKMDSMKGGAIMLDYNTMNMDVKTPMSWGSQELDAEVSGLSFGAFVPVTEKIAVMG